jgi:hypothetical protein
MPVNLKLLLDGRVAANDGELGWVHDCYFDDHLWTVRYFVVDIHKWLPGRRVLISPDSARAPDPQKRLLPVNLTKDQVRHSPDVSTELPVARQHEVALAEYYEWPQYWDGMPFGAVIGMPVKPAEVAPARPAGDPHLRSLREILEYQVQLGRQPLGSVLDLIADPASWKIQQLLLEDRRQTPPQSIAVPVEKVASLAWERQLIEMEPL